MQSTNRTLAYIRLSVSIDNAKHKQHTSIHQAEQRRFHTSSAFIQANIQIMHMYAMNAAFLAARLRTDQNIKTDSKCDNKHA
jgi:hypothetical protein